MRRASLRAVNATLLLIACSTLIAPAGIPDGATLKAVLTADPGNDNLLRDDGWRPFELGFERRDGVIVCDNGGDAKARRGASQTVVLDQARPEPIVASAWSRAENVGGGSDNDYSLYLDIKYADGTPLYGQTGNFRTGTHDWSKAEVLIIPEKPIKQVSLYLLLRGHTGRALFKDPALRAIRAPEGAAVFDGVPVLPKAPPTEGFQVRDVAAGSGFVAIGREALGLRIDARRAESDGATFVDATISDITGKDRAISLIYALPVPAGGVRWLEDPRRQETALHPREYVSASRQRAGANGRLSRYPFAAIDAAGNGMAIGIDMGHPSFFRAGLNMGTRELFLAFDLGLAPEKSSAHVRFCIFKFDRAWGFRAALARYHALFPDHFRCRTPRQGNWMPFAKISALPNPEDFGFAFKEGNDETKWDDAHGILTFRYTEPMTWWMKMPKDMPRTIDAAEAEARRLAGAGDRRAAAFAASAMHDASGRPCAELRDTPWCDGAVWSMNSIPGIPGEHTDFKLKWNPALRDSLYGPDRKGDLDGEYVDSSEGYVTAPLDFRREHFAAADTPLTFATDSRQPAIFRGLVAFEYVRAIARDIHAIGGLMMANSTPHGLCWLAPMLDVLGTETDWNRGGTWRPMGDAELLYRRALCGPKPYCFLMNTGFEKFTPDLVERYMRRALAYGMFPGFFSADASTGHYFKRPELYERDRPLFKKYVPLCRLVAEAGWRPVTRARSSDPRVYVERFGERHLTVFNDSPETRTATITLEGEIPASGRDLVSGARIAWREASTTLTLDAETVAVIEWAPQPENTNP